MRLVSASGKRFVKLSPNCSAMPGRKPAIYFTPGSVKFIFDAGRGALQRLYQLKLPFGDITGMFLTHHHSDHLVGFTDLWLTGWIGRPWGKRTVPLKVWGPAGTHQMVEHLPLAFATDIRVRTRKALGDVI